MRKESMLEVRKDSKSILAKLLATENITVEHGKFNTASFDVKNRVLRLPILKEMSGDIYDLMVLHEVGHALWTPEEGWHGKVSSMGKGFKSYLNVVEDARIEKKIKNRYPGGRRSFITGYNDLIDRDFFGTRGRDLNDLGLIDRINLYTKGGTSMGINFNDDEISFVNKIESLETFEDALRVAEELYNYAKENESETDNHEDYSAGGFDDFDDEDSEWNEDYDPSDYDKDGLDNSMPEGMGDEFEEGDEGMNSSADGGSGENDSEGEDGADSSKEDSGSDDKEKSEKTKNSAGAGSEGGFDGDFDPEAETDNSWRENEKELVSEDAKEYLYLNIPKFNLDELIVSYKNISALCTEHYAKEGREYGDASEGNFEWGTKKFNEFRTENKKIVEYLAKEFEMKKAASEYSRAATANSGIIDSERLHTYKFNDQLFKKITVIPDGKNHGLVMLVDWSGSMSQNMKGTIEQMICLVMFCKRVNIPFEVYAFSDHWYDKEKNETSICSTEINDIQVGPFRLLNLFSSKMKANELRIAYIYMTIIANAFSARYGYNFDMPRTIPNKLSLGGTPLNSSLLSLFDVIPAFKKSSRAEIVNVIFLTDGESNSLGSYWAMKPERDEDDNETGEFVKKGARYDVFDKNVIIKDRRSKTQWNLSDRTVKYSRGQTTHKLVEALKERFSINIVNFFLIRKMDKWTLMQYFDDADHETVHILQKEWRKNKFLISKNTAWSELYVIQGGKEFETNRQEFTVGDNATNAQLRTAFRKFARGKLENRKMLSSFVEKVAA